MRSDEQERQAETPQLGSLARRARLLLAAMPGAHPLREELSVQA